jgi:hypothetical protein
MNKFNCDVAIIGAGSAGIMSAIVASQMGKKVILIEKNNKIGKKFLLTGNGKCNLTNAEFNLRELVKNYNNGEFLFNAFSVFGPKEAIDFFEKIGIKTVIKDNKRVFPESDSSKKVLEILENHLKTNNVDVLLSENVLDVEVENKAIKKIILEDKDIIAKKYIFCTGGKSFSSTGSDGFGYQLVKKMGHTIVDLEPALCPIKIKEKWVEKLQGISFKDKTINVLLNKKKQFSEKGEFLFTHFGISGPAILNISGRVGDLLKKGEVKINFDFFPLLNEEQVFDFLEQSFKNYPLKIVKNILSDFFPERFVEILLDVANVNKNKLANSLLKNERKEIAVCLKNFIVTPESVFDFNSAMVTRGGVSLKEIDHKTMQSKLIKNLFFAGEIIDIDGKTGGFNLQFCWSTGFLAGRS